MQAKAKLFWVHSNATLSTPTQIPYITPNVKNELIEKIRKRSIHYSNINDDKIHQSLLSLKSRQAKTSPWLYFMPDLSYLLIYDKQNKISQVYSLIRNKSHSNVSFIFGETLRRLPDQDSSSIIEGSIQTFSLKYPKTE